MPRKSLSGFLQRAPFIDVQSISGQYVGYSATVGNGSYLQLYADNGNTVPMRLLYTPPVDAWWEVWGQYWVQKVDANYHYSYGAIALSPADADGIATAQMLVEQHSTVQIYEPRIMHRLFKLQAGVAYTAALQIYTQGGSFQYYKSPNDLWLNAKAWPR